MNNNISTPNLYFKGLPKFQRVVDNKLVRGRAVTCPWRLNKMKNEGITQVIDLRNSSWIERPVERFFCKLLGIKYINFRYPYRLNELPPKKFFDKINQQILNNQGKTYIHCQYGKRRTGISVAIYEKFFTKKSKKEILSEMFDIGFQELKSKKPHPKKKKLERLLTDFMKKYYPEG